MKIINIHANNRGGVYGLGDDGKVYRWLPWTATWEIHYLPSSDDNQIRSVPSPRNTLERIKKMLEEEL